MYVYKFKYHLNIMNLYIYISFYKQVDSYSSFFLSITIISGFIEDNILTKYQVYFWNSVGKEDVDGNLSIVEYLLQKIPVISNC